MAGKTRSCFPGFLRYASAASGDGVELRGDVDEYTRLSVSLYPLLRSVVGRGRRYILVGAERERNMWEETPEIQSEILPYRKRLLEGEIEADLLAHFRNNYGN